MKTEQKTTQRALDYNVGALVVLVISVGVAIVVYGANIIPFKFFDSLINVPAWIFGPLGVFTLIYSFVAGKESTYYLVWGTVMFAIAIVSAFYNAEARAYLINPIIVVGILVIVIAVIGLVAYMRSRK